ncbi:MAG TPA: urea transporter, partial [Pirellulales bacterium]|nr:urea transporter [Pirellulales bacterium]
PWSAALSLLGATTVTGLGYALTKRGPSWRAGLFGVNGVLLGYATVFFPEVNRARQLCGVAGGAALLGVALAVAQRCGARESRPCVPAPARRALSAMFTLPYVLALWLALAVGVHCGAYDWHLFAGWSALADAQDTRAEAAFDAVQAGDARVAAYAADGLGWSAFRRGDFAAARARFEQAAALAPSFADPYDGAGWSDFRQGDFAAAAARFSAALALQPSFSDSLVGQGWLALARGDAIAANEAFLRAAVAAPLNQDAYAGLARCAELDQPGETVPWLVRLGQSLSAGVAPRYQFVPAEQIACWLCFALGVFWHSRISAASAALAVAVCILGTRWLPEWNATFTDLHFVYNLIALFILGGGLYFRLNGATFVGLAALTLSMAAIWQSTEGGLLFGQLPLFTLPINGGLALGLALCDAGQSWLPAGQAIPPPLALSSPEQVRLWFRKAQIARACWEKIAAATAAADRRR